MKKTIFIISAILALVLLAVALMQNVTRDEVDQNAIQINPNRGYKEDTSAVDYRALEFIPAEAVTIGAARFDDAGDVNKWWGYYRGQLPYMMITPSELSAESSGLVSSITYAQFVPQTSEVRDDVAFTGALVVMTKDGKASELADLLYEEIPMAGMNTIISVNEERNVLTLSEPIGYNTLYQMMFEESEIDPLSESDYAQNILSVDSSSMWFNMQGYLDRLISFREDKVKSELGETIEDLIGLQKDSIFVASSKDYGETWDGQFTQGGYDKDHVERQQQVVAKINESFHLEASNSDADTENRETWEELASLDPEEAGGGADVEVGVVSLGLTPLLDAVSIAHKTTSGGAVIAGEVMNPEYAPANEGIVATGDLERFDAVILISPQMLHGLLHGTLENSYIDAIRIEIRPDNIARLSYVLKPEEQWAPWRAESDGRIDVEVDPGTEGQELIEVTEE